MKTTLKTLLATTIVATSMIASVSARTLDKVIVSTPTQSLYYYTDGSVDLHDSATGVVTPITSVWNGTSSTTGTPVPTQTPSTGTTTVAPSVPSVGTTVTPSVGTAVVPSTYTANFVDEGIIVNEEWVAARVYEVDGIRYHNLSDVLYATGMGNVEKTGTNEWTVTVVCEPYTETRENRMWVSTTGIDLIVPADTFGYAPSVTTATAMPTATALLITAVNTDQLNANSYDADNTTNHMYMTGYEINGDYYCELSAFMQTWANDTKWFTIDGLNGTHRFTMSYPNGIADIYRYESSQKGSAVSYSPEIWERELSGASMTEMILTFERFAPHSSDWGTSDPGTNCSYFTAALTRYMGLPAFAYNYGGNINFSDIEIGDLVDYSDATTNGHIVAVLEVYADRIVVAEGNNGGRANWGRTVYFKDIALRTIYKHISSTDELMDREGYRVDDYINANPNTQHYTPSVATTPVAPSVTTPTPEAPTVTTPATTVETITNQARVVYDGNVVAFEAYTINQNNYFKLRDLAMMAEYGIFNVVYDYDLNAICITTGEAYEVVGGEMSAASAVTKTATLANPRLFVNGTEVTATAYNIEYNNFFKLRDIGDLLGWTIDWDAATGDITVATK